MQQLEAITSEQLLDCPIDNYSITILAAGFFQRNIWK